MKFIYLTILIFSVNGLIAQMSEKEDELRIMFAEEKYEKLAGKSLKYAEKKKYKKDPIPYLYASKACLEISKSYELRTKYPKSFKDALKYATKYRKKDDAKTISLTARDHIEELKKIIREEIANNQLEYSTKKTKVKGAKKSVALLKKVNIFAPKDQGAVLMRAVYEIERKNNMYGKKLIKKHLPLIKMLSLDTPHSLLPKKSKEKDRIYIKAFKDMTEMEQIYLRDGLILYAKYLKSKDKTEEAKEVIEIGKPFFYEENINQFFKYKGLYKKAYNELVKG